MVRRTKRNRWAPSLDEVQSYEHANDTRFGNLVDDIHADPLGRGRVRPTSPLASRPAPVNQDQADADASSMLGSAQASRGRAASPLARSPYNPELGDTSENMPPEPMSAIARSPYNPELGDTSENMPPEPMPPEPMSPLARSPYNPELGDTSENMPPEPMSAIANTELKSPNADKPEVADPYAADAVARPDFGRVNAATIEAGTAGDEPARGDKWLAAARGVGSVLMSAGGQARQGMEAGLDTRRDYMAEEGKHRDWTERNANLKRDAAKEQRGENRYAQDTNYGRARDEDSTLRAGQRDRAADADSSFNRDRMSAADARAEDDRAYDRDPARRAEGLEDYRGRKKIDAEFARKRGTGAGRRNNVAQFDAARQRLIAKRGGEANLTDEDRAAISYAANDLKDPGGILNSYVGKDVTQEQNREQVRGDKLQAASAKAAAAKEEASGALRELQALKADALAEMNEGAHYIPGKEPLGQRIFNPELGLARLTSENIASVGGRGSSGFTPRQQRIQSGGKLVGRGKYLRNQGNSANLKAESDLADADIMADGSLPGMLQRLDAEIAALGGAIEQGAIVPRDANGNRIDDTGAPEQQATPPIPPGFEPY